METKKNLGIWMDHSIAELIYLNPKKKNHSIEAEFDFATKEEVLSRSEKSMHNKRQQQQEAFYKEIADEVLKVDHVLLFGPTNAKTELHNYMTKDLHFKTITIDVASADKMTDNEKIAFAKQHFMS